MHPPIIDQAAILKSSRYIKFTGTIFKIFAYIQLFGEYVRVEGQMPLGDVHTAMVQETPLQSTGVTLVNNLQGWDTLDVSINYKFRSV